VAVAGCPGTSRSYAPVTIAPAGIVGAASSEEIQIAIEGELVEQPQTAEAAGN